MKRLLGIIWGAFGVGLFLYGITEIASGREVETHALAVGFGVFTALAGVLSFRRHPASRLMLLGASISVGLYSLLAFAMVGGEFGPGFILAIIPVLALCVLTVLRFARK